MFVLSKAGDFNLFAKDFQIFDGPPAYNMKAVSHVKSHLY